MCGRVKIARDPRLTSPGSSLQASRCTLSVSQLWIQGIGGKTCSLGNEAGNILRSPFVVAVSSTQTFSPSHKLSSSPSPNFGP